MDPGAVEQLGHRLQQHHATRIQEVARQLDKLVGNTSHQWPGPKGNQFRSWWPAKRAKLLAIAQDLHGYGQSALNNATEQRGVSKAGFAPSAPGGGPAQFWNHLGLTGELAGWVSRAGDLALLKKQYDVLDSAAGWKLPRPGLGALGVVNTGIDVTRLLREINNGSLDGSIRRVIDVGFDVFGMFSLPVGLGKTSWDVGWWTGSQLERALNDGFGTRDAAYDSILYSRYGTTNLTPQQAHEMAHRYDGASGFLRWGGDTVTSWFKGW